MVVVVVNNPAPPAPAPKSNPAPSPAPASNPAPSAGRTVVPKSTVLCTVVEVNNPAPTPSPVATPEPFLIVVLRTELLTTSG